MLFLGVTLVYGKNMLINLSYKSAHGNISFEGSLVYYLILFLVLPSRVFSKQHNIKLSSFPLILTSILSLLIEVQGLQLHKAQRPYKR